jgi:hypothetical protein
VPIGYAYVHSAVDAYSRVAYSEVLGDEQAVTAAAFWVRANAFFATLGIDVERALTDIQTGCRVWDPRVGRPAA